MNNLSNFSKKFGENLTQNIKLANYSWFNLGGNASIFLNQKINHNY